MAGRFRKGQITTPDLAGVVNIQWNEANEWDRTAADDELAGDPVLMRNGGSGSFELVTGSVQQGYLGSLVMTVADTATGDPEVETTRTFTFTKVTVNAGLNAPNDGQRGGLPHSFDFATVTES